MMYEFLVQTLSQYLSGLMPLRELEEWIALHLQDILDTADARAVRLVNELDVCLIEISEGLAEEAAVQAIASRVLSQEGRSLAWASSSSNTIEHAWNLLPNRSFTVHPVFSSPAAGRAPGMVSA